MLACGCGLRPRRCESSLASFGFSDTDETFACYIEYRAGDAGRSFAALARRHGVKGGRQVVLQWWRRWDGTAASLQRKQGSGKKALLSTAQVQRHIAAPIRAANRAHRAISYPDLLPQVQH